MATVGIGATTSATTGAGGATSVAPAKPASLAVGDLLVANVNAYLGGAGGGVAITPPAGWTTLMNVAGGAGTNQSNFGVYWKVADSNDVAASSFTFTFGASTFAIATLTRYTGEDTTTPITASHSTAFTTGTTPTDTGLTAGVQPVLVMVVAHADSTGRAVSGYQVANTNPTWTEQFDTGDGHGTSLAFATAPYTLATATGTAQATLSGAALDGVLALYAIQPQRQYPTVVTATSSVPGSTPVIQHRQLPTVLTITTATGGTATASVSKWGTQTQSASGGWSRQAKSTT